MPASPRVPLTMRVRVEKGDAAGGELMARAAAVQMKQWTLAIFVFNRACSGSASLKRNKDVSKCLSPA
jgi:hypothetical protein